MRIRLITDAPVAAEHGMTKGRELEVYAELEKRGRGSPSVLVIGDTGAKVALFTREYEEIDERTKEDVAGR